MKTVGQFIKELSVLNQNKPIWIYYDGYELIEPTIIKAEGTEYSSILVGEYYKIQNGDYLIEA